MFVILGNNIPCVVLAICNIAEDILFSEPIVVFVVEDIVVAVNPFELAVKLGVEIVVAVNPFELAVKLGVDTEEPLNKPSALTNEVITPLLFKPCINAVVLSALPVPFLMDRPSKVELILT